MQSSAPPLPAEPPLRVMVVDDAVVVRGLMSRWFAEAGGIEVASTHRTGLDALAAIERVRPDVVVLDIEMPDMDGLTALPLLLRKAPGTAVIVASTLTSRNADVTLRCLSLGALDYIAKPSTNRDVTFSQDFRRDIVDKVRALGLRRRRRGGMSAAASLKPGGEGSRPATGQLSTRALPRRAGLIVVGASTGGPKAVNDLLRGMRPALQKIPVVVVQHMPPMFTAMFAQHLSRALVLDAAEAQHGEMLESGRVYVAPGGRHLRLTRSGGGLAAAIDDAPPVNFCRPSVDVAFASAAAVCGERALGVVLTGMGADGVAGAAEIVARGGAVLAQDEATSVVWGMPGSVVRRGLCAAVQPIDGLAHTINTLAGADSP